jgi:hypothetical protein
MLMLVKMILLPCSGLRFGPSSSLVQSQHQEQNFWSYTLRCAVQSTKAASKRLQVIDLLLKKGKADVSLRDESMWATYPCIIVVRAMTNFFGRCDLRQHRVLCSTKGQESQTGRHKCPTLIPCCFLVSRQERPGEPNRSTQVSDQNGIAC